MYRQKLADFIYLLKNNKLFAIALFMLLLLYLSASFAGFISPYRYDSENRAKSFHPPTPVYFTDGEGGLTWPYVKDHEFDFDDYRRRIYKPVEGSRNRLQLFPEGEKYSFLGLFETRRRLFGVDDGKIYLFGADSRGRDLFSRIIYGGRVSLSIGLIGVSISLFLGLLIGGISGYVGGLVDNFIQRLIEVIMLVPAFFLLLALRSAFPLDWTSVRVYFFIIIIMSFIGWASLARVIRGMVLSLREKQFVDAARVSGVPGPVILIKHILPNTASYFIVAATVSIPGYILGESALSLLGLGIQDPHASWGNLLQDAMSISQLQLHPWVLLPGLFIFLTVMSFNLVGDALRDILDPEHEVSGGNLV